MKILSKLLLYVTMILTLFVGLFYAANNGKLDKLIKHALHYYFKLHHIDTTFLDCHFKDGLFTSPHIQVELENGLIAITDLKLQFSLLGKWNNPELHVEIMPTEMIIQNGSHEQIVKSKLESKITKHLLQNNSSYLWSLKDITLPNIKDINGNELEAGLAEFQYIVSGSNKQIEGLLNFGKTTYLNMKSLEPNNSKLQIDANNIPLRLHRLLYKILPNDTLLIFFRKFIKDGHIQDASISLDLNDRNIENTLLGKATIRKLDLNYKEEYPILKNMNVDVDIQGSNVKFYINSAYSSNILLSDGVITMDWKGLDNTNLVINAMGHGPASDLADFISKENLEATKKANIDFYKIKGVVDIDINVIVPLKPGTANIYNITAIMPNSSLNIFKDNISLKQTKISGLFNGDQLLLNGHAQINGFNSDINFIYNVNDQSAFNHRLNIKTSLLSNEKNAKIVLVDFISGKSIVDVQYENKNSQGFVSINSDISQLELFFNKLGISKKKDSKSRLIINGIFEDPTNAVFDFSVAGDSNLNINGNIIIKDDLIKAKIATIKTKETDISANLLIHRGSTIVDIKGKRLDLSNSNLLQFLDDDRATGTNKIRLNLKDVQLRDNIVLSDLNLKFECNNTRCVSGFMDAKIGSRSVEMLLTVQKDKEEWLVKTSNAGAFLRGIGAYNDMKAGNLTLNMTTSRTKTASGKIVPILNGMFTLDRFVLSDTPVMSRIVSVVSLPGFINAIRGNQDIIFSGMSGNFSYANNILNIENSAAEGPYFNFNLKGNIDVKNKLIDIKGHVNPKLYGVGSVVSAIPLIGNIFTGTKKRGGLISGSYHVKDSY